MSFPDTDSPYQTPSYVSRESERQDERIPATGEYLIDGRIIRCCGAIRLPRVCIRTGVTDDLIECQTIAQYHGFLSGFLLGVLGWLGFLFAGVGCIGVWHLTKSTEATGTFGGVALVMAVLAEPQLSAALCIPIAITFFESQAWRNEQQQWFRKVAAFLTIGTIVVGIAGHMIWGTPLSFPAFLIVAGYLFRFRTVRALTNRNGVFSVLGLPTKFLHDHWGGGNSVEFHSRRPHVR